MAYALSRIADIIMNSAYTDLPASLAAKEMGAKQKPSTFYWWRAAFQEEWKLDYTTNIPWDHAESVAALPWLTDDPNEQSVVGLLESSGYRIGRFQSPENIWTASTRGHGWNTTNKSLSALLMACYEKWKESQK